MPKNSKQAPRKTARYQLLTKTGIHVESGITGQDLEKRLQQHRSEQGKPNLKIKQVGPRVTRKTAEEWERQQRKGTPPGGR